jgi:very-short-patch-repair endonuclease
MNVMTYYRKTSGHWVFYGAYPETFRTAHLLRKNLTSAEERLWIALRNRKLCGYKFRRQHPVREFIVDFYCAEKELVIEVDGKIHLEKQVIERDQNRSAELERMGISIIRFTNDEIMDQLEEVLKKIQCVLTAPSPSGEGVGGEAK